jgi:hypothetical protein
MSSPRTTVAQRRKGWGLTPYAGTDGIAPIAYLGQEGWRLSVELREGTHFSSRETEYTLDFQQS